jgi:hypothetical protein
MGAKWILNVKDHFGASAGAGMSKKFISVLWVANQLGVHFSNEELNGNSSPVKQKEFTNAIVVSRCCRRFCGTCSGPSFLRSWSSSELFGRSQTFDMC